MKQGLCKDINGYVSGFDEAPNYINGKGYGDSSQEDYNFDDFSGMDKCSLGIKGEPELNNVLSEDAIVYSYNDTYGVLMRNENDQKEIKIENNKDFIRIHNLFFRIEDLSYFYNDKKFNSITFKFKNSNDYTINFFDKENMLYIYEELVNHLFSYNEDKNIHIE